MTKIYLVSLSLIVAAVAFAATPKVPSETELKSMTLETLLTFNKGVQAKDFTGFYKDIAKLWQEQTTPEKLQGLFQDFIDKELDISPIKKLEPVFNKPAEINSDDVLVVNGYYPTTPKRVVFKLQYLQEQGDWKLVGIKLDTVD
ncbi:MAG TPA: hypothetical protein VM940_03655 [Chthoniobacterales bacterium]|nr:hypothetical protein [Chthoniobacterales bacterium]